LGLKGDVVSLEQFQKRISQHNSTQPVLSNVEDLKSEKDYCLYKLGHNTPSPDKPGVTPFVNTSFEHFNLGDNYNGVPT
jgi:hypothetical protein